MKLQSLACYLYLCGHLRGWVTFWLEGLVRDLGRVRKEEGVIQLSQKPQAHLQIRGCGLLTRAPAADRQQWLPRPAHGLSAPGALGATYNPKTQQGPHVGLLEPSGNHRRSWDNHENRGTVTATPTQSCDRCRKMSFYRITANLVLFFLVIYSNWENSGKNKQRK